MTRVMFDAIHDNTGLLRQFHPQMVAGYDTGSSDIKWTQADWDLFPDSVIKVHIDQAFGGQSLSAHVVDMEKGAWTPEQIDARMVRSSAPRPTLYCSVEGLIEAAQVSHWRGDVWLAAPGFSTIASVLDKIEALIPDVKLLTGYVIVAIQDNFANGYDTSVVFDDNWPLKGTPVTTPDQYAAPANFGINKKSANFQLAWSTVPNAGGDPPDSYTVVITELDGTVPFKAIVHGTTVEVPDLVFGWTYHAYVWANGGTIAPPHAEITFTVS